MSNPNQDLYKARLRELGELGEKVNKKLKHVDDAWLRGNIALMIGNQTQHNENAKVPKFIQQISIPATIHTLTGLPNLFGIQVFKGPAADVCFHLNKAGDPESIVAIPYKPTISPNLLMKNIEIEMDPEEIAYQCVEIAVQMTDDIVRSAVDDMAVHAGHQLTSELHSVEGLVGTIKNASETIKESIGKAANFVVLPVSLARYIKSELVTEYDFDALPINVRRVGYLRNRWVVYINGYEAHRILVGYRGSHPADAGYVLCPALQFCEPKKEKDRYMVFRKSKNCVPRCNYFACVELTADKRAASMDEF